MLDMQIDNIIKCTFSKKHKFKNHEAQNVEILRNIAGVTLTNATGKITLFNTVMF